MADATIGSVGVEVVPNATDFWKKFKAATQGSATPTGADLGDDLGKALGDVAGPEARERLERSLKDLDGNVHLDTAEASAEIEKLQLQVDRLGKGPGGGGGGNDLGGIGSGAKGAGLSISSFLVPAIGAALTLVGPLAAVGAGAFGTLLLGAQGLEKEVQTGLTPVFRELQAASASALEPGLEASIGQLQQALPKLVPLVGVFGQALGDEAEKFTTFLNNGGLQAFAAYAERELPIVEKAFNSALEAGVSFFDGLTPIGNELLGILTKVTDGINIINKFFDEHKTSGGSGSAGSSGAGSGVDLNSYLFNPATSARAAGNGLAFGGGGANHNPTVGPSGPVFGVPSFISSPAKSIYGLFQNGKTPSPALNSQQLQLATNNLPAPSLNSQVLHNAVNGIQPTLNSKALSQATAGYEDPGVAASAALSKLYASLGTTATAYGVAKSAADGYKDSTAASTLQMQLENNAAGLLSQALQGLGGDTLGVAQSNTAFHASISAVNDSLKQNGTTLDINTEKGQANRQAIEAAVSAAQQHAQAVAQQTGSTQQATDAYNADITALEKQLGATGQNKDAIDAYIDSIGKIPPLKTTQLDIEATLSVTAANLGQDVHSAINDITPGQSTAKAAKPKANALGVGSLNDGWFSAGENGIEYGYKQGSSVSIFSNADSMAMMPGAASPAAPQTINLVVDGRVLASVVAEQNLMAGRR